MKNKGIHRWLWKWHVIAGLITVPFIVMLAITGGIYLFKTTYEQPQYDQVVTVTEKGKKTSYADQWITADSIQKKKHTALLLPKGAAQATQFISGKFSGKKSTFVDPYKNEVKGTIAANDGFMYQVRKLHGELLLGGFGTKIIELIASWMVVLLITGIIVWWPAKNWRLQSFFIPRFKKGKKILYRDIHAITAFWISGLLLLVLAGGFPWTDIVGSNYKKLQKITNTGFPSSWFGVGLESEKGNATITLDTIVKKANELNLSGKVTIEFPKGPHGVYSISNTYPKNLDQQQKIHYNQYSGKLLLHQKWDEVGVLMRARMWVMAFHQGDFGRWNWWLMLGIAMMLIVSSIASIASYFSKKEKGTWVLPSVPDNFIITKTIIVVIVLLGILFPLFGISALLIYVIEKINTNRSKKHKISDGSC